MGRIHTPRPVKLIIGFLYRDESVFNSVLPILRRSFGPVDVASGKLAFTHTDYYAQELGASLVRAFISFDKLIDAGHLAHIKVLTNAIESKFSKAGKRRINIDPGYVTCAKLVLASTKDFAHRIYVGKGIFAEVTLVFRDNTFRALDWTYPDYRSQEYLDILNGIRNNYAEQIKSV